MMMTTRTAPLLLAGTLLLSGFASRAQAQEGGANQILRITAQTAPGQSVREFQICPGQETVTPEKLLNQYAALTGKRFIYDPNVFRGCAMELRGAGRTTFKNSTADRVFQGILRNNGLALVPLAEDGLETYSLERISSSKILKAHARPIAFEDVAQAMERPAEIFVTVMTLQHVPVSHVRQATQNFITSRTAEFIQETSGSNSLVVCGFGPTVANIATVVRMLDRQMPDSQRGRRGAGSGMVGPARRRSQGGAGSSADSAGKRAGARTPTGTRASRQENVSSVILKNARATQDLARAISGALGGAVRIMADSRTNSMILLGSEEKIKRARLLLEMFDMPVKKKL